MNKEEIKTLKKGDYLIIYYGAETTKLVLKLLKKYKSDYDYPLYSCYVIDCNENIWSGVKIRKRKIFNNFNDADMKFATRYKTKSDLMVELL